MDMINIKINGIEYSVPKGSTILEAAQYVGIKIPTLCYMKEINAIGAVDFCEGRKYRVGHVDECMSGLLCLQRGGKHDAEYEV